jgi:hypothetical protein
MQQKCNNMGAFGYKKHNKGHSLCEKVLKKLPLKKKNMKERIREEKKFYHLNL